MLLTIYDKAGTKRADVAVNDSSTQSKEVQGDNVLSLSFSYYAFLPLDVNDYTDYLVPGAGDDGRGHQPPVYPDGHAPRACGDGGEGYQ